LTIWYILVANRVDSAAGGYIPAPEIVARRLAAGRWPLFKNTPHQREVTPGDQLFVYLAGHNERRFVARCTAGTVEPARGFDADGDDALTNAPFQQLLLVDPHWFPKPIPISAVKDQLAFVPKGTRKWGCVMQRGIKKISNADAEIILAHAC
jgi:hypothetical protein